MRTEQSAATRVRSSARDLDVFAVLEFNEGQYQGETDAFSSLPNGQGVYRYHSGDVYSGAFLNNNRHGYGRMVYHGGQIYEGQFRFNVPTGTGQLIQTNGDSYVGQFRKSVYSGQGKLNYANGNEYRGTFKRSKKHGFGRFLYANGDVYEGWFRRELPHGWGKLTFAESGYSEEGQFVNGRGVGSLENEGFELGERNGFEDNGVGTQYQDDESEESSDEEIEEISTDEEIDAAEVSDKNRRLSVSHSLPLKSEAKSVHLTARTNADFKDQSYWDQRFENEDEYEWLLSFDQIRKNLLRYLPLATKQPSILVVGCGNSSFSADLYDAGYQNIINIDFSKIVIDKMRDKNDSRKGMTWLCMDMTRLTFSDQMQFDVVIDKAAMDAIMVDEGDVWNPRESVCSMADSMCLEMRRVLSRSGIFLQISFMQPHFRTKYLMSLRRPQAQCECDASSSFGDIEKEPDPYSAQVGRCERFDWTLGYETIDVEAGCLSSFLYRMAAPQWKDPHAVERKLTRRERIESEKHKVGTETSKTHS